MSFQSVAREMFSRYRDEDYEGALEVVRRARDSYPEQDNALTFWEACLLSRSGNDEEAVAALLAGVDRGEWWPTGKLLDADLDPIRGAPGWDRVLSHCRAMTEPLRAKRPATLVKQGAGSGTIVTLKGGHGAEEEMFGVWKEIAPAEWTVVTPFATEPNGDGGWEWPLSLVASAESVADDLQDFSLSEPIVLAGFSAGSAIASQMILSGLLDVSALIAIGPWSNGGHSELEKASESVRTLVICGDDDPVVPCAELHDKLGDKQLVSFELVAGLGHANPTDLGQRVGAFLLTM